MSSRILSEERSFRNKLSAYLTSASWTGLKYSEGWNEMDIENPLVNVYVGEQKKTELEMGRTTTSLHYERFIQVDVFMESENRTRLICEDIAQFMDETSIEIADVTTPSGTVIGYLTCNNSEEIIIDNLPPDLNDPEILRWRGIVKGPFEAFYPLGGSPL